MDAAQVGPGAPHRENVHSSFEVQTAVGRVVCACVVCVCMHTCRQGLGKTAFQGLKKKVCAFEGLQIISGGWKNT